MDPAGFQTGLDILRHFRHDIFVIHVASHEEVEPVLKGELVLVDSENNVSREITVTPVPVGGLSNRVQALLR